MKDNKNSGAAARRGVLFAAVGLIIIFSSNKLHNSGLMCFGFILFAVGMLMHFGNKKQTNTPRGEIRNGVNRVMPDNNTYVNNDRIRSGETKYTKVSTYNECLLDNCKPNQCPICKRESATGYCNKCGYRFRH